MRIAILAGAASLMTAPAALAAESEGCRYVEARVFAEQQPARTPNAPRVTREGNAGSSSADRAEATANEAATTQRRRKGKPIPDAELIGPRAVL